MLKLLCLCFSSLVVSSYAVSLAPFITKCQWKDKACLLKSSQAAVQPFVAGNEALGIRPLDPLTIAKLSLAEDGLNLDFIDVIITGLTKCLITDVNRDPDAHKMSFNAECPIEAHGKYVASGKLLFLPVTGNGPFHITIQKLGISVSVDQHLVDGKDGQKHWKISNLDHSFEAKEKAVMTFENLFDGDQEKAAPINALLEQNWKDIVHTFGKPLVNEVVESICKDFENLLEKVPASELEL